MFERRRRDAISPASKINFIEIKLDNFIFGECFFHPARNRDFADFTLYAVIITNEEVLCHLLRQG